jgi:hypothetical protein
MVVINLLKKQRNVKGLSNDIITTKAIELRLNYQISLYFVKSSQIQDIISQMFLT